MNLDYYKTFYYVALSKNFTKAAELLGNNQPNVTRSMNNLEAELYRISRTTVQNAYFQLAAEGYIYAKPQSGYFVAGGPKAPAAPMPRPQVQTPPRLDLTGNSADLSSFDFSLWQRYIKSALRQRQRLLTYSEPQGEYDLRCALADYVRERRNVVTAPEHIVVGAGVQMLLEILCVLLKGRRTVSFPDGSFVQGSTVFAAHGYTVRTRYKDADIIYVSPSHMNRQGDVMPIQRRLELCAHSAETGAVVIEDDFENDFLYSSTPTPSLYALGSGNVVYMGAFSALLLPGIRISFMVLSPALAAAYHQMKDTFAQTASKTEQIALCAYLRDGNMKSRTKKIRRLYTGKAKTLCALLAKALPDHPVRVGENGLQVQIETPMLPDSAPFEQAGLALYIVKEKSGKNTVVVSPSAVPADRLEEAALAVAAALYKAEEAAKAKRSKDVY